MLGVLATAATGIASASLATPGRPTVAPAPLTQQCADSAPRVVFPQSSPFRRSGVGAVLWQGISQARGCAPSHAPMLAPVTNGDLLASPRPLSGAAAHLAAAAATARGQVIAALQPTGRDGASMPTLTEAPADRSFPEPRALVGGLGPAPATATGYLGDVAVAWVAASPRPRADHGARIALDVQRYFAGAPVPRGRYAIGAGAVSDLGVTLDYRTDALLTWVQSGRLLARFVSATGPARAIQTLGSQIASEPAALVSDDGHAIVAWVRRSPAAGRAAHNAYVYLSISGADARFGPPRLVERFSEPSASAPSPNVALVRLSTESVTMAWSGRAVSGRYVVRSASVGLSGLGPTTTLSDPHADAVLATLAAGPRADALAVWSGPSGAPGRTSVAGRLFVPSFKRDLLGPMMNLAAPGPYADPAGAFDPASDRALVAWRAQDTASGVRYALVAPLGARSASSAPGRYPRRYRPTRGLGLPGFAGAPMASPLGMAWEG